MAGQNRRQFFRLPLPHPLSSNVTIIQIKNNAIETGKAKVLIEDISPGGLRFISNVKLPATPQVILEFETEILNNNLQLPGYIVRKVPRDKDMYEYGVKFTLENNVHAELISLLQLLSIRLRRTPLVGGCRFATNEELEQLNRSSKSS
ncbi:PilZ domain-containing protein [Aneurinibacillus aneurinilyticus]|uniref:PilZ domain-containing protein n=1 Tax=Aneurinibacillus aneurinilyticus TaxID=1391 RepID=A0A848CM08_ANEAE|nr:PilZ domain-containing protein [Aneurinibacillus aneurinilyticus]NME98344.1 PilZ domain-containing protein [Aneurinibacillus aneurinilyticus]